MTDRSVFFGNNYRSMDIQANRPMKTLSIQQYQNQFPRTSAVPSITQTGELSILLHRLDQRQARRRRRRELRRKLARRAIFLARALRRRIARRQRENRSTLAPSRRAT